MVRRSLASDAACLVFGLAALGQVHAARGDDWPQFRRDSGRSAASMDKVTFPLADVWSWNSRDKNGSSPLYHATVWRGKVYFTAVDGSQRSLICADLKTGKVRWRQPMLSARLKFPISEVAGPAVTQSGIVYAYDWIPSRRGASLVYGQKAQSSGEVEAVSSFTVRTFDANTGEPGLYFPLATMGANGVLPRVSLTNTPEGQEVRPVPPTFVGCPP